MQEDLIYAKKISVFPHTVLFEVAELGSFPCTSIFCNLHTTDSTSPEPLWSC